MDPLRLAVQRLASLATDARRQRALGNAAKFDEDMDIVDSLAQVDPGVFDELLALLDIVDSLAQVDPGVFDELLALLAKRKL